ncbi:peptidyl-prolyl cis-trans isomerase [Neisseria animalis]|uniref:Peptidyl-prolyl cis-trans isomerase n=1 Tax=Neisseria animalis TaxID=492 RepID=A0A5P3MRF8_NEIAN|nr:peptidylprolyl isomerase [Neisseria animalis]QEY24172.1 peptidyl-prolyl cis-trans isomerase [Neisseria animalis]ROW32220.1 peptidyl-prolyl cis-trans isomerase [Neisseria animalis]VEE06437.1 putative peptidyl-prolyl isomerasen [Neisseria animalis]
MKPTQFAAAGFCAAALAGFALAKAPEIDPARVDSMVAQILKQADQSPDQTHRPDGKALRQDVITRLQTLEVLKNEAIKLGLDKDPEVQHQFETMQAQFYAGQYTDWLERQTEVSERDLRRFYDQQTRMIKLQQVSFESEADAFAAQELLLKGLSFEELMQRHPNDEQAFDQFIMPQQLSGEVAAAVETLNRGDVTRTPVALHGRYYLFKLSAVERNPEAQPFELVRRQVEREFKQQKVRHQIDRLLQDNGITPPHH